MKTRPSISNSNTLDDIPVSYFGLDLKSQARKNMGCMKADSFQDKHYQILALLGKCSMKPGTFAITHNRDGSPSGIIFFTDRITNPSWDTEVETLQSFFYASFSPIGWIESGEPKLLPIKDLYMCPFGNRLMWCYPSDNFMKPTNYWVGNLRILKPVEKLNGYPRVLMASQDSNTSDSIVKYSTGRNIDNPPPSINHRIVMGLWGTGFPVILKYNHYYSETTKRLTLGNTYATSENDIIQKHIGSFLGKDGLNILMGKDSNNSIYQKEFMDVLKALIAIDVNGPAVPTDEYYIDSIDHILDNIRFKSKWSMHV